MFSKSRPVPSKGALRVLYQLAYISSGTAVGVAALCAEERRRRTVICQKIKENAKRLRQSPRYVGNVATAAREEEGDPWLEGRRDSEEKAEGQLAPSEGNMASRTAELPSEVERNYKNLVEGRRKGKRKKVHGEDGVPRGGELKTRKPRAQKHATEQESKRQKPLTTDVSMLRKQMKEASEAERRKRKALESSRLTLSTSIGSMLWDQNTHLNEIVGSGGDDVGANGQRESAKDIESEMQNIMERWPSAQSHGLVFSGHLGRTAELSSPEDYLLEPDVWNSNLLAEATEQGNFAVVRRLVQLKIDTNRVTQLDLHLLCRSLPKLIQRTPLHKLIAFFKVVMGAESVRGLPIETQVSTVLTYTAQVTLLGSQTELSQFDHVSAVLDSTLSRAIPAALLEVEEKLTLLCRKLLASSRDGDASRLAIAVISALTRAAQARQVELPRGYCSPLINELLAAAIAARNPKICSALVKSSFIWELLGSFETLLNYAVNLLPPPEYKNVLSATLSAILRRSPSDSELDVLRSMKGLDTEARGELTRQSLLLKSPPIQLLEVLYNTPLPENSRLSILKFMGRDRLRRSWSATRNFDRVWADYEASRAFFRRADVSVSSVDIDVTMVEICTEANQLERALELLSDVSRNNAHSSNSLSAAAAILAKKGSWAQLEQLLELLKRPGKDLDTERISRNLNGVIQLFSLKHSVSQTWDFVVNLVDKGIFRPNRHTSFVMLNIFVRSGSLDSLERIMQWFHLLHDRQYPMKLETDLVVSLIWTFYIKHRPAHTQLMWYCRTLIDEAPGLNAMTFRNVAKEAVAYDLRKVKDKNTLLKAGENLRRLQADSKELPEPMSRAEHDEIVQRRNMLIQPPEAGALKLPSGNPTRIGVQADHGSSSEALAISVSDRQEEKFEPFAFSSAETAETDLDPLPLQGLPNDDEDALLHLWYTHEDDQIGETATAIDTDTELPPEEAAVKGTPKPGFLRDLHRPQYPSGRSQTLRVNIERDMILALSLGQYNTVIELYHQSQSQTGLPASPLALEVAVDASLRDAKGNPENAERLLTEARDAGFNTASAMGPLLLQQMWHLDKIGKRDAHRLQASIAEYYRLREQNGWPVKDHVGITAANILVNNGRAEEAVALLRAIYDSKWVLERPLNIVAMTVYLKAYSAMRYFDGVRWVFAKVLTGNMPIDRTFVSTIKYYARPSFGKRMKQGGRQVRRARFMHDLNRYHLMCIARRAQQKWDSKVFGWKLMHSLRWVIRWQMRENPNTEQWIHMAHARHDAALSTLRTTIRRSRAKSRKVDRPKTGVEVELRVATRKELREMRLKARKRRAEQSASEAVGGDRESQGSVEEAKAMSLSEAMRATSRSTGKASSSQKSAKLDKQAKESETYLPFAKVQNQDTMEEAAIDLPGQDDYDTLTEMTFEDDPEVRIRRKKVANNEQAKSPRPSESDTAQDEESLPGMHAERSFVRRKKANRRNADRAVHKELLKNFLRDSKAIRFEKSTMYE